MFIRTSLINRLEWDLYSKDENEWVIPSQTNGLKRKKMTMKSSCNTSQFRNKQTYTES